MKKSTERLQAIATNPWVIVIAAFCSITSFLWFLYDKISESTTLYSAVVMTASVLALLVGYIYSIRVRSENIALKDIAAKFGEINLLYKNTLTRCFLGEQPLTDPTKLIDKERETLGAVCERISSIYSRLINRDCTATVKFLIEENDRLFARTLVRSEPMSLRDEGDRQTYVVGERENTAFDKAIEDFDGPNPCYYFSPDLTKESEYRNQRHGYLNYYKCVLVVPICMKIKCDDSSISGKADFIGFLCLDTKSANRLNDRFHLQMLSSLANQMYNFISLMRGRYTVFVD